MVPNSDEVHAYFEIPLLGSPGLDVHCALSHVDADVCVPEGADPLWRSVVRWFSQVGPIHTGYNDVAVMAEADTSGGSLGQVGVYLVQHDQAQLVRPFLEVADASDKLAAWELFGSRLLDGWATTYVGVFAGRGEELLRVNAHPAASGAVGLEEALAAFGLANDEGALASCLDLVARAVGFDLQMDVDEEDVPAGAFALELYLEEQRAAALVRDKRRIEEVLAQLEELGVADARWRSLVDVEFSRQVSLPSGGALVPYAVSVRPFSVKVRFKDGKPLSAKVYLRADAGQR